MRIWGNARDLAARTPESRNRYVDFLRAASILVVVIGHWLIATVYYQDGSIEPGHLLQITTDLHWMTWVFQVMPIFFIVGGFSNSITLQSAHTKGQPYATWLAARLNRLVAPLLFLLIGWGGIALLQYLFGVSAEVIQYTSRSSLIPTWFLAIYIMVVVLAPVIPTSPPCPECATATLWADPSESYFCLVGQSNWRTTCLWLGLGWGTSWSEGPCRMAKETKDRTIVNIHRAEYRVYDMEGPEQPEMSWSPLSYDADGNGCYVMRMSPGAETIWHEHRGVEDFLILEGELICDTGLLC